MFLRKLFLLSLFLLTLTHAFSQDRAVEDFNVVRGDDKGALEVHVLGFSGNSTFTISGEATVLTFVDGVATFSRPLSRVGQLVKIQSDGGVLKLYHLSKKKHGTVRWLPIPLWLSIMPPLIAIILALVFKEVILALFIGIWSGAFIVGGLRIESPFYFLYSIFQVVEKYLIKALADSGHLSVIIFSLLIGGMVAIISRNGGMAGVVKALSKYARSSTSAQFITWLLGVAIFFDDYANTLIVGNTMRSVTDRFRISREKLAYIVDSTAAPVAAVAFITTWIGAELGYIDGGISQLDNFAFDVTAYSIFISSLKYSFYPILTLGFIVLIIRMQRDFGPMYKAEMRARSTGQVSSAQSPDEDESNMEDLQPVAGAPLKWQHAVIPVMVVVCMTIVGLISTGMDGVYGELQALNASNLSESWATTWSQMNLLFTEQGVGSFRKVGKLIGAADSYVALLWASLSGVVVAIVITLWSRTMKLLDTMDTLITGFKTMVPALIILSLAWSLAITTEELHTATFLSAALANSINPYWMPAIIFVLAAIIAFSTGSSWSTMAILYPIAIPMTWTICQGAGMEDPLSFEILLNVIATVLGASVLGDHCSPISDTTILSSLASDCNHIDHVRTQMPYALLVGIISVTCSVLSTLLGGGWLISLVLLLIAFAALYLIIRRFGKVVPTYQ